MELEQNREPPRPISPPQPLDTELESILRPEKQVLEEYQLPRTLKRSASLPKHTCHEQSSVKSTSRNKLQTLEQRLSGAMSSIKHLEKLLKEKDSVIEELKKELQEKTKSIEAFQSAYTSSQVHQKNSMLQTSITSVMRKKEKEMQRIINDQQTKIEQDKKTLQRLQSSNKELLQKLKEAEHRNSQVESSNQEVTKELHQQKVNFEKSEKVAKKAQETQEEVNRLQEELETWKSKYYDLVTSSMEFEEKTRSLYKANQILNENLLKLLDS